VHSVLAAARLGIDVIVVDVIVVDVVFLLFFFAVIVGGCVAPVRA